MSDVVLDETPLWMQDGTYAARLDRALMDAIWQPEGRLSGLVVSPRAAGANLSVDVAGGYACIAGDDQVYQGKYLVNSRATPVNVPTQPAPTSASQKRIDLLVMTAIDLTAGAAGPTSQGLFRWVMGTATTGTPAAPAVPPTAIELARVTLIYGQTSVLAGDISSSFRPAAMVRNAVVNCTSSTRPPTAGVPQGALIFETDTLTLRTWDGSAWQPISTDPKAPRGRLPGGYTARTSNAGPQGVEAAFGVSITVTVVANRLIRLDACCRGVNIVAPGTGVIRIKEGGTELYSVQYPSNAGGGGPGGAFGITITPAAGTHTYFLSLEGAGGAATLQAAPTYPTYLEAIDVGGA